MDEARYWLSLEFRVSDELAQMSQNHLRYLWCDGFTPQQYLLTGPEPHIKGLAWICNGPRQDEWEFVLFLPHPVGSQGEIDWASMLPPENVTRWLALDQHRKRIEIEPGAAVLDFT